MPTRPRLVRSIPFWILVLASLVSAVVGALLLTQKLATMTKTLTDGSATGVDVYVGQSIAVFGTILIGAGIIGLLLALTVASLATLRPVAPTAAVAPTDWAAESAEPAFAPAEPSVAEPVVAEPAAAEPVVAEPVEAIPAEPVDTEGSATSR